MLNIGCHISISKGYSVALENIINISGNTFQFFTRNPRGGRAKDLDEKDIEKLQLLMREKEIAPLLAHGAYTMNLCSDKEEIRTFAKEILKDDLKRVEMIGNTQYVFHPGSHVKQGVDLGIEYIVEGLNEAIGKDTKVNVLLETMSGKGTEIGRNMEELKRIIDGVKYNENMGICLDTCHLYSSGYDIVNDLDGVLAEIDQVIGLHRVKAIHLNDSKMPFASNKDRHEIIGGGTIGLEALVNIINHPSLKHLPFNLETPNDMEGYKREIKMLRKNYKE